MDARAQLRPEIGCKAADHEHEHNQTAPHSGILIHS